MIERDLMLCREHHSDLTCEAESCDSQNQMLWQGQEKLYKNLILGQDYEEVFHRDQLQQIQLKI